MKMADKSSFMVLKNVTKNLTEISSYLTFVEDGKRTIFRLVYHSKQTFLYFIGYYPKQKQTHARLNILRSLKTISGEFKSTSL